MVVLAASMLVSGEVKKQPSKQGKRTSAAPSPTAASPAATSIKSLTLPDQIPPPLQGSRQPFSSSSVQPSTQSGKHRHTGPAVSWICFLFSIFFESVFLFAPEKGGERVCLYSMIL